MKQVENKYQYKNQGWIAGDYKIYCIHMDTWPLTWRYDQIEKECKEHYGSPTEWLLVPTVAESLCLEHGHLLACGCDTYWVKSMCCPKVQERMHPPFAAPQCLSKKRSVCSISNESKVFIFCRHIIFLSWDSPELFPDSHRKWWCSFTEWLKDALNIICFLSNWDPPGSYLCLLLNCLYIPHCWQQQTRQGNCTAYLPVVEI